MSEWFRLACNIKTLSSDLVKERRSRGPVSLHFHLRAHFVSFPPSLSRALAFPFRIATRLGTSPPELTLQWCDCPSCTLGSDYNEEGRGDGLTPHGMTAPHAVDVPDSTEVEEGLGA